VTLTSAYSVLVAFASDAIGLHEFRWPNLWGLALALVVVVALFFLIEAGLRGKAKNG